MPLKSESRVIGGRRFTVHQLPFGQSRDLLVVLGRVVGPALSGAASADGAALARAESLGGLSALANGLGGMLERLEPSQLDRIQEALAAHTFVDLGSGKEPRLADATFEAVFSGALESYFEWLYFALEVNYAGFFGALRAAVARRLGGAKAGTQDETRSGSSSPPDSIGRSTGSPAQGGTATA